MKKVSVGCMGLTLLLGGVASAEKMTISGDDAFYLIDSGSGNSVGLLAPSLPASYSLTLPDSDGLSGQVLTADGSGALSWETPTNTSSLVTVTSAQSPYTAAWGTLIIADASGGAITINMPAAGSNSGKQITVIKKDSSSNMVTLDGNSSETICGQSTVKLSGANDSVQAFSDGTNVASTNCYREFTLKLLCSTSSSSVTQDPMSILSNIATQSSNVCSLTAATGVFSSAPTCSAGPTGGSVNTILVWSSATAGSIGNGTGGNVNFDSTGVCRGPR